jgi:putative transposase
MYEYRTMTPEQRAAVVAYRHARGYPLHSPPHPETQASEFRLISAACHSHVEVLGTPSRLAHFEEQLLALLQEMRVPVSGWCVQPNHYHVLARITNMRALSAGLGRLHGRTSHGWNVEDATPGRQVWFRCQERWMRSDRHYFTTLNYIHHNPVHHGWVARWQDWPYSSCHEYLETMGRNWLLRIWREYPLKDYGAKWDPYRAAGMGRED